MTLRLYLDHHVPAAVSEGLRLRGVDVLTAYEDGSAELEDHPFFKGRLSWAASSSTQDTDLLAVASEWQKTGREFAGLLYGHQLQLTIGQAIRHLELAADVLQSRRHEEPSGVSPALRERSFDWLGLI